ncbi:MAG TPA: ATP-binding protein [Terracidiphilus sp.]|nr:ATP-binding protein [Terracidiphilus sp.]
MQLGQLGHAGDWGADGAHGNRQRVEAIVQTLSGIGGQGESLAEVAHDARNMVTALGLYCDLLDEPGVLAVPYAHYGSELRLVAAASRRLVEKLVALDAQRPPDMVVQIPGMTAGIETRTSEDPEVIAGELPGAASLTGSRDRSLEPGRATERIRRWDAALAEPIENLAAELQANRNLLSALAGAGTALTMELADDVCRVRLTAEDLTRLLVNLVRNAAEAMLSGGQIRISLRPRENPGGAWVAITVEDDGPGIAPSVLPRIFESGFTTRGQSLQSSGGWPTLHRGLGLAISRHIVEGAGGRIWASNRAQGGACFEIELPVRTP